MGKRADCRIELPNGEALEIHDEVLASCFGQLAQERERLLQALSDLEAGKPGARPNAHLLLKEYGKR